MKKRGILAATAAVCVALCVSPAQAHPPVAVVPPIPQIIGGGSSTSAVGGVVVWGIGALTLWCGLNQPDRGGKKDRWVDRRHENPSVYNPRKTGCIVKDKPKPISVRS